MMLYDHFPIRAGLVFQSNYRDRDRDRDRLGEQRGRK